MRGGIRSPEGRGRKSLYRRICDRRGVVAVEMALVTTIILVPLLSMIAESGQALLTQYRLSRALHAGLISAWGGPTTATASSVQSAASAGFQASPTTSSGYGSTVMTPVAAFSYYCIDPTVGTHSDTAVASNATCPTGQVVASYVTLSLTATLPSIFPAWKGSSSWALSVSGMVRLT